MEDRSAEAAIYPIYVTPAVNFVHSVTYLFSPQGGAFDGVMDSKTPFMYKGGEGINAGVGEVEWVIAKDRLVQNFYTIVMITQKVVSFI